MYHVTIWHREKQCNYNFSNKNHRIFCGKSNTSERGLGPSIHRSMNGINTHVEVLKFHKKHGQIMIQSTADSLYLGRKVRML